MVDIIDVGTKMIIYRYIKYKYGTYIIADAVVKGFFDILF